LKSLNMAVQDSRYVAFDDPAVEPHIHNEESMIDELINVAHRMQRHNFALHRHYMRVTHVKTQGIVKGELTIEPDLATELAQGIASAENAAKPHPVAIRFANEPSWLQDDRSPGPRGCSMRIFDVMTPGQGDKQEWLDDIGAETRTQDLTFNNAPQLELRDLSTALDIFKIRERNFLTPDKIAAEIKASRDDAELQLAPASLPNHHFLAYTMYSQSAYRWGPYVAKYALFPTGKAQSELVDHDKNIINSDKSDADQHSKWLRDFFNGAEDATFDLRVQLCETLAEQPVEDCGREWDEGKYPFRTVGKVRIPAAQSHAASSVNEDPMGSARRTLWDDRMKLNVWYGLSAHRPLGSVNRLRRRLYAASAERRAQGNAVQLEDVKSSDAIP